jgi:hypothetical protein
MVSQKHFWVQAVLEKGWLLFAIISACQDSFVCFHSLLFRSDQVRLGVLKTHSVTELFREGLIVVCCYIHVSTIICLWSLIIPQTDPFWPVDLKTHSGKGYFREGLIVVWCYIDVSRRLSSHLFARPCSSGWLLCTPIIPRSDKFWPGVLNTQSGTGCFGDDLISVGWYISLSACIKYIPTNFCWLLHNSIWPHWKLVDCQSIHLHRLLFPTITRHYVVFEMDPLPLQ